MNSRVRCRNCATPRMFSRNPGTWIAFSSSTMWMDLDFEGLVIYVRRAYVWGRFKEPKSKASKAPVPLHPLLAGFLLAWREKTTYPTDGVFVFPSTRLAGSKPLSASILVQKYLRPAAVKAGVLREGQKVRFGFHNFRH